VLLWSGFLNCRPSTRNSKVPLTQRYCPVREIVDGAMTWMALALAVDRNTLCHFMAVSVWIERSLFTLRNRPLCAEGVFHELVELESAIEGVTPQYEGVLETSSMKMLESLRRIRSAPGLENEPLITFASQIKALLDQDIVPMDYELVFPRSLIPSLATVVGHVDPWSRKTTSPFPNLFPFKILSNRWTWTIWMSSSGALLDHA
jgi:hypothetical protein